MGLMMDTSKLIQLPDRNSRAHLRRIIRERSAGGASEQEIRTLAAIYDYLMLKAKGTPLAQRQWGPRKERTGRS